MKKHYLFDSTLYYCFLHIILFFYIYSVQFTFIPFGIGTRVLIGMFGFFSVLFEIVKPNKQFVFSKYYIGIYLSLLSISAVSLFTLLYNSTSQSDFFVKYQLSIITIIFAGYLVTKLIYRKNWEGNNVPAIMNLFINVVIIQIIIALLMFSIPPLRDFLNNIQLASDQELEIFEETMEFRLVGFGSKFFGSGIINGFTLILIGSIVKLNKNSEINVFKYSVYYLFVFVFGMMMARTTIVGALLSLAIIFWPRTKFDVTNVKKNFKFLLYLILVPVILLIIVFNFLPNIRESLELAFNFGFEMFVNYFESNSLESESTNQMKEMYIWPTSLKTYLIGDGMFGDPSTGGYYMGTDIGILRLIYYFGIFGVIAFAIFQFQIIYGAYTRNRKYKYMFLVIFIYFMVLNYKGFTDLFFLVILFYINNTTAYQLSNEKYTIHNSISS